MDDGKLLLNIDGTGTGVLGTHAHMHCILYVLKSQTCLMQIIQWWRRANHDDATAGRQSGMILSSQARGWFLIIPIFWAFALNSEFYVANSLKTPVILHPSELTS